MRPRGAQESCSKRHAARCRRRAQCAALADATRDPHVRPGGDLVEFWRRCVKDLAEHSHRCTLRAILAASLTERGEGRISSIIARLPSAEESSAITLNCSSAISRGLHSNHKLNCSSAISRGLLTPQQSSIGMPSVALRTQRCSNVLRLTIQSERGRRGSHLSGFSCRVSCA